MASTCFPTANGFLGSTFHLSIFFCERGAQKVKGHPHQNYSSFWIYSQFILTQKSGMAEIMAENILILFCNLCVFHVHEGSQTNFNTQIFFFESQVLCLLIKNIFYFVCGVVSPASSIYCFFSACDVIEALITQTLQFRDNLTRLLFCPIILHSFDPNIAL